MDILTTLAIEFFFFSVLVKLIVDTINFWKGGDEE